MIFICEEKILNGTVTMNTLISGIVSSSFELAKNVFKEYAKKLKLNVIYLYDNDKIISWEVKNNNGLKVVGEMKNKNLYMIEAFND